jgi:26S proteasome regulatory subunit N2
MGSILSTGILNSCGRNATISLTTRDGNIRPNAVAGLVLFCQHWYWYPLLNFISLAYTPTALIAVDKNLKVPKSFTFISKAKPSMFKYPEFQVKDEGKTKGKIETAVLSTTAIVKARKDRKSKQEHDNDGSAIVEGTPSKKKNDVEMIDTEKKDENKKEEEKKEDEDKKPEPEPEE